MSLLYEQAVFAGVDIAHTVSHISRLSESDVPSGKVAIWPRVLRVSSSKFPRTALAAPHAKTQVLPLSHCTPPALDDGLMVLLRSEIAP